MSAPSSTRVRVQGFHCDLYGHVNNARYLEFLEAARWEALDRAIDVEDWHEKGWNFVIVNINIDYRRPATLGDVLTIHTRGGDIGRTSAQVEQEVLRESDGEAVARATITYVILDARTGRPHRITGEIREGLERLSRDPDREHGEA